MKLNQELIKRLANGEIVLKHTGTVEQLNEILQAAFPDSGEAFGDCRYYKRLTYNKWRGRDSKPPGVPIFTTEQFYEQDHIPDVGNKINTETRELAKELFVAFMYAGNLPAYNSMNKAIETAKEFIQMLDEAE